MKLTKDVIDRARAKAKPYRLRDSIVPGLFLRVQPTGVKSWNVAIPGAHSSVSLGKYPGVSLDAARKQAHERLAAKEIAPKKATFAAFVEDYGKHIEATNKAGKATVAGIRAQWMNDERGGIDLSKRALASVSEIDIARFKADRLKTGIGKVTINRDLDRLRAALNVAREWKLLAAVPTIKHLKVEDSTRVRFLSKEEEKRLRAALRPKNKRAPHLKPLVLLGMNTGCRRGELLSLDWASVDLDARQLRVTSANSKSGKQRYVPLNDEALAVLKGIDGRKGLVFPSATGKSMTNFKRSWAALTKTAQLTDFHFHDLRHHFASMLVQRHVDLFTVGKLLGHSGAEMTDRYAHLSGEHLATAVRKLAAIR